MDTSAFGSTNVLQEDDGHQRVSSWSLIIMRARNCSCLNCLTGLAEPKEKWLLTLSEEGEMVCQGSYVMNKSARHSAGYRRLWPTNYQYTWNCLGNFLFHEKFCQVLCTCGLKMGCLKVTEEIFMTVQAARCLCQFWNFRSCLQCTSCLLT